MYIIWALITILYLNLQTPINLVEAGCTVGNVCNPGTTGQDANLVTRLGQHNHATHDLNAGRLQFFNTFAIFPQCTRNMSDPRLLSS